MRTPLNLQDSIMGLWRALLASVFWVAFAISVVFLILGIVAHLWVLGVIGLIGIVIGTYSGFVEPRWFEIALHDLRLQDGKKREVRIVFLSDFHTGAEKTRAFYARLFTRVAALKPDLILLGGDYVECLADSIEDLGELHILTPRFGMYFVLGNHDYWDDPRRIQAALTQFGAKELTGVSTVIGTGDEAFVLTGIDDAWLGTPQQHLPLSNVTLPRVLLTHESDILCDLPEASADLVLLGHTHGGQVRIPGYGSLTALPQSTPAWLDHGLKVWRGMRLLISRGLGESSARVRLFARPQIVVIDL
jgi:predicted MPP superfamily phosphohydrolase